MSVPVGRSENIAIKSLSRVATNVVKVKTSLEEKSAPSKSQLECISVVVSARPDCAATNSARYCRTASGERKSLHSLGRAVAVDTLVVGQPPTAA
jgi:hypothetical protein